MRIKLILKAGKKAQPNSLTVASTVVSMSFQSREGEFDPSDMFGF